jgi:hypothetical protein
MHEDEAQPSDELIALGREAFDRAFTRLAENGEDDLRPFALLVRSGGEIVERLIDDSAETLAPLHEWVLAESGDADRYAIAFLTDVETEDGAEMAAVGLEGAEGDDHTAYIFVSPYRWNDEGDLEVLDDPQAVGNCHTALHSHDHDHDHEHEEEISEDLYELLQAALERATAARNAGEPTTFALIGHADGEPVTVPAGNPDALEDLERAVREAPGADRYVLVADAAVFAGGLPDRAFRLEVGEAGTEHGLVLLQPYELVDDVVRTIGELELVDRVGLLVAG